MNDAVLIGSLAIDRAVCYIEYVYEQYFVCTVAAKKKKKKVVL